MREEWLLYNHEAEFRYENKEYVLQPEAGEGKMYLVIWNCTEGEEKCICRHKTGSDEKIGDEDIDAVLNDKCFEGKSFLEIEKDVIVDTIL